MTVQLRRVYCPQCHQKAEITSRSVAWCSRSHASAQMLPVEDARPGWEPTTPGERWAAHASHGGGSG